MTSAAITRQAIDLPIDEQADAALEQIANLDGEADPGAKEAWAREIEHRARRAMSGETKGTDWTVVRARVAARLRP